MSSDVREDILARLLVIVATIPNMRSVHRGNVDVPEEQLPTTLILDGDEETDDAQDTGMRPPNRPTVVRMTPEIVIGEQSDESGSDINTLRRELIKRVLFDTELNEQIVKTGRFGNGAIRYLGCRAGFGWGRMQHAVLLTQFMFKYTLKPDEL